jgi:hypothetical protein
MEFRRRTELYGHAAAKWKNGCRLARGRSLPNMDRMNQNQAHQEAPSAAPISARRPLAIGLILLTSIVMRLIPNGIKPPNVAPFGAQGLLGGARLPLWLGLLLQFVSLVISDLLLWRLFDKTPFSVMVYVAFAIYLLLGRALLRGKQSARRLALVSLLGSIQFFLLTNFGTWYGSRGSALPLYPPTFAGLVECYVMGLPFFGFTVAGDLGFSAVLFGAEAWLYGLVTAARPAAGAQEVPG